MGSRHQRRKPEGSATWFPLDHGRDPFARPATDWATFVKPAIQQLGTQHWLYFHEKVQFRLA